MNMEGRAVQGSQRTTSATELGVRVDSHFGVPVWTPCLHVRHHHPTTKLGAEEESGGEESEGVGGEGRGGGQEGVR